MTKTLHYDQGGGWGGVGGRLIKGVFVAFKSVWRLTMIGVEYVGRKNHKMKDVWRVLLGLSYSGKISVGRFYKVLID